jgi:ribosomal protein S18 acetylase RimI-like enzyme
VLVSENLRIKTASDDDLLRFPVDNNTSGLLRDRLQRQTDRRGELWLAIDDGELVGHVYLWLDAAEEEILREGLVGVPLIMNLWVRDNHRHEGIGKALVATAERRLQELGHDRVALGVAPDNEIAIQLYERLAYEPWERAHEIQTRRLVFGTNGDVIAEYPDVCAIYVKTFGPI